MINPGKFVDYIEEEQPFKVREKRGRRGREEGEKRRRRGGGQKTCVCEACVCIDVRVYYVVYL